MLPALRLTPQPSSPEPLPAPRQAGQGRAEAGTLGGAGFDPPAPPTALVSGVLPVGMDSILQDLVPGLTSLAVAGEAANQAARERLQHRETKLQGRQERQRSVLQAFAEPTSAGTRGPSLETVARALEARERLHAEGLLAREARAPIRGPLPGMTPGETALVQILPPGPTSREDLAPIAGTLQVDLAPLAALEAKGMVSLRNGRIEPTELGLLAQRVAHYDDPDVLSAMDIRLAAVEAALFGGSVDAAAWTRALTEDLQRPAQTPTVAFHRVQIASMHAYDVLERAIEALPEGHPVALPRRLDDVATWYRFCLPDSVRASAEVHLQRLEQAQGLFSLMDHIQKAQKEGLAAVHALVTDPATYRQVLGDGPGLASGQVVAAKAAMTAYAALGAEATPHDAAQILQAVLQRGSDRGPLTVELLSMFREVPAIIQAALWTSEGQALLAQARPSTRELHHLLFGMIRPTLSWHQDDVQATVKDLALVARMAGHALDGPSTAALVEEVKRARGFDAALRDLFLHTSLEEAPLKNRQDALLEMVGAITTDSILDGDEGMPRALTQEQAGALLWAVGRIAHSNGDLESCVEAAQAAQAIALHPLAPAKEKAEMTQRASVLSAILSEVTGIRLRFKDAEALKEAYMVSALRHGDGSPGALQQLREVVHTGIAHGRLKARMSWPESAEEAALQAMIGRTRLAPLKAVITEEVLQNAAYRAKASKDSGPVSLNLATPSKGWTNHALKDMVTERSLEIGDVSGVVVFYDAQHTLLVPLAAAETLDTLAEAALPWGKAVVLDLVPEDELAPDASDGEPSLASRAASVLSRGSITTGFLHLPSYLDREAARQFSRMND